VGAFLAACTTADGDESLVVRLWAGGPLERMTRWQEWAMSVLGGVDRAASGGFATDGYGGVLGESGVRATFGSAGSKMSVWFTFPGDERLGAAAAFVQEHAPGRLSSKHGRRWTPARSGDGYRSARMPSPLG